MQEAIKAFENEETILKQRIERIRQCAVENLKELRNKSVEMYLSLDEANEQRREG
jgi:Tfp pilus assembly protein PilO